jgi:hypothetical protein
MSAYDYGIDVLGAHGGHGHGHGSHGHGHGRGHRGYGLHRGLGRLLVDDCDLYDEHGDCLGPIEIIGYFDIASRQHELDSIKQVPVTIAQTLLATGIQVINQARQIASENKLPGGTARDNVFWKLQWHAAELAKLAATPNAFYASGADLKKWVMQAFVEYNAAEEGAEYLDSAWSAMWSEIKAKLAAMPAAVVSAVGDVVTATGLNWVLWGGLAVVGLLGFATYKILTGPAGGAISGAVVKRYLP